MLGRTRTQRSHPIGSRCQINPQPPLPGKAPSSSEEDGQNPGPRGAASCTEGVEHGSGCAQPAGDDGAAAPTPSPLLRSPGQGLASESGLWLFCFRQPELVKRKKGSLSQGRGFNPVMCLREKRGRRSEEDRPGTDANSLRTPRPVPALAQPQKAASPPSKLTKHLNLIAVHNFNVSK